MFFKKRKKRFMKLDLIGIMILISLILTIIIFLIILPKLAETTMVFLTCLLIFIIVWMIVYIAMVLGASVYKYSLPFRQKQKN